MENSHSERCHLFFPASSGDALERVLSTGSTETSTNVLDLDEVVRNLQRWKGAHPNAVPLYSPSVNNHPTILALLAKLDVGFSCASTSEMRTALNHGLPPDQIRLMHPAKSPETILFAKGENIHRIVCDSVQEITKVYRLNPEAHITLRIRVRSDQKFGCCPKRDVPEIFNYVKSTGAITITGIQFVIPQVSTSGGESLQQVLLIAAAVLTHAHEAGITTLRELVLSGTETIPTNLFQDALVEFNMNRNIRLIVETERRLVESAVTLVTSVQSKRVIRHAGTSGPIQEIMYFINDGRYGSFEWWHVEVQQPTIFGVNGKQKSGPTIPSSLWGPTCDSADVIFERIDLPQLNVGDCLVFPGMGAYGVTLASRFNGFPIPKTIACARLESTRAMIEDHIQVI